MSLASVRRLSVCPSICPRPSSVCLSIRLSVNIFLSAQKLEYLLEYFDDTSQLCRTGHDDVEQVMMMCHIQKMCLASVRQVSFRSRNKKLKTFLANVLPDAPVSRIVLSVRKHFPVRTIT